MGCSSPGEVSRQTMRGVFSGRPSQKCSQPRSPDAVVSSPNQSLCVEFESKLDVAGLIWFKRHLVEIEDPAGLFFSGTA